jgi:hypothetical protein
MLDDISARFVCIVALVMSLCKGRFFWVIGVPLSTLQNNLFMVCNQTCSCYLVWTIQPYWWWSSKLATWSDWKQWLLQVSSLRNFVAFISSNTYACCACGKTVLFIFWMEWVKPTHICMMAQSLDASVSSLMFVRLVNRVFMMQSYCFVSVCMTVLNSASWNSFLTSCPWCFLEELPCCVQYNFLF